MGQKDIGNYNKGRQNQKSAIAYETRSNWFALGLFLFLFAIIAFQQTPCISVCIRVVGFFFFFCSFETLLYMNDLLQNTAKQLSVLPAGYLFLAPCTIPFQCNDMKALTGTLPVLFEYEMSLNKCFIMYIHSASFSIRTTSQEKDFLQRLF